MRNGAFGWVVAGAPDLAIVLFVLVCIFKEENSNMSRAKSIALPVAIYSSAIVRLFRTLCLLAYLVIFAHYTMKSIECDVERYKMR